MGKSVRRFSQGSPIVSSYIRDLVKKDVHYKDDNVTKLPYIETLSEYSLVIPIDGRVMVDKVLEDDPFLTDRRIAKALEEANLINWCPGVKKLIPLSIANDGNTLCHSTSVALWGTHDRDLILRNLISSALQSDQNEEFHNRWLKQWRSAKGVESQDIETEWKIQIALAKGSNRSVRENNPIYDPLEEFHIFVLSNVIRRPIIVYSDRPIRSPLDDDHSSPGNSSIYLPLLWDASRCIKSPLVLGYYDNYFSPLVTFGSVLSGKNVGDKCPEIVPLVTEDQRLIEARFLTTEEEKYQEQLFKDYLTTVEIEATKRNKFTYVVLSAKMLLKPLEETNNLLVEFLAARSSDIKSSINQPALPLAGKTAQAVRRTSRFRCGNKSCDQFITKDSMFPYCVTCYEERAAKSKPSSSRRKNTVGNLPAPQVLEVECTMIGCPYFASVNCFPYCQRCHERRLEAGSKGEALPTTLMKKEASLEDKWLNLAMGAIHEDIGQTPGNYTRLERSQLSDQMSKLTMHEELSFSNQHRKLPLEAGEEIARLGVTSTRSFPNDLSRELKSSITGARSTPTKRMSREEIASTSSKENLGSSPSGDWKRKVSWVNEPCSNVGCSYFASVRTYPFCNQCSSEVINRREIGTASRKISGTARTLPTLAQDD